MYPSEWAATRIDILAKHHAVVWIEDPYSLIEAKELTWLVNSLSFTGHSLAVIQNAFDLRQELLSKNPETSRLVLIDQSYTLRDPHLLPKDAKPGDLVPIPAPDWKPFVDKDAFFRPTVRDFLQHVTDDERWPVEVNIYPFEELARSDPDGFVRAFHSFRQTGRTLTSEDLVLVGASAAFGLDLLDLSEPVLALGAAFHCEEKWQKLSEFFNPSELELIKQRLCSLPSPIGDLFGPQADTARLAVTALLILGQHFDDPGIHLPVLSAALAPYASVRIAATSDPPSWFVEEEVPKFEQLITAAFGAYVSSVKKLGNPDDARIFAERERLSSRLRALALPTITPKPGGPRHDEFDLTRLVPEFRDLKQTLLRITETVKPKIERIRLTPLKNQTARGFLEVFHESELHIVDSCAARIDGLIRDIEGPAKEQWDGIPGFLSRWTTDVRECRDTMSAAGHLRDDLDYLFGRLLESRYADIIPSQVMTTRAFYADYIAPCRRTTAGSISKAVVLVIDGMRFDLWHQLIRPALERDYQIEEKIAFSELPSETRVSRGSFFAGVSPGQLPPTIRESDLFAELLERVHGQPTSFQNVPDNRPGLRYAVRSKDQLTLAGVFDFADVLSHRVDWSPFTMQQSLRPLVRELQSMLRSEGKDTLIFITSDHGHHLHEGGAPIYLDDASNVGYRSAYVTNRVSGQNGQHLFQIPAVTLGHNLPGLFVFPRPRFYLRDRNADKGSGRPGAGYRHGGLSLLEVAIPLVRLRHRSAPTSIQITLTPRGDLKVGEEAAIEASLTADGVIHSPVRLSADTTDVQPLFISNVTSTPSVHKLSIRPGAPGRQRITITAHLGEEMVGSRAIEVDVAAAPVPEDEAKRKLRKIFGDD